MKRATLAAALVLAVGAGPVLGEAKDCLPDKGCGEDEKPPSCCQPPPCDLLRHLATANAMVRMLEGDNVGEALAAEGGDFDFALALLRRTQPQHPSPSCQPGDERTPSPTWLEVGPAPSCKIGRPGTDGGAFTPVDWDQARERSKSCEELESAQYDRLFEEQLGCLERARAEATPADDDLVPMVPHQAQRARFANLQRAWQKEVDGLNRDLLSYWKACSNVSSVRSMLDIVTAGLDVLSQKPDSKTPPPLQRKSQKRTGGRARRGS